MKSISDVSFFDDFLSALPGEIALDLTPRPTPNVCYSLAHPTPVKSPKLVAVSQELALEMGLHPDFNEADLKILTGNLTPKDSEPYSLCYGGHQFGHWAGQLGDGRAINLGEIKGPNSSSWRVQLKGAGPTPYSRTADGRAVLRSSLREFLASEAMHFLGVPTTRALSLSLTGEVVLRDMFYSGNVRPEPGAIVARVAPSFLRFGNFELLASQGDKENLKKLFDWTLKHHFPELADSPQKIEDWFIEVCKKTSHLILEWIRVGFVHGVMNTDNMSILGLTIDYGPYGFLETYEPMWTPNTTDLPGRRYAFAGQAPVAHWNLQRLGEALGLLGLTSDGLKKGLEVYKENFSLGYFEMMLKKLGLKTTDLSADQTFISELDDVMKHLGSDYTLFFRRLANWDHQKTIEESANFTEEVYEICSHPHPSTAKEKFHQWLQKYQSRLKSSGLSPKEKKREMDRINPKYILRNSMAYLANEEMETEGTQRIFDEIYQALKDPYSEQPDLEKWAQKRPEWAENQPGSSTLSCSS